MYIKLNTPFIGRIPSPLQQTTINIHHEKRNDNCAYLSFLTVKITGIYTKQPVDKIAATTTVLKSSPPFGRY